MKTLLASAALVGLVAAPAVHAEIWQIDPSHTEVVASWDHVGFSRQSLKFHAAEGQLDFTPGNPEGASAEFSILVDSVDTGVEMLDNELKGETFFHSAEYPRVTFVSTEVEQTGDMTLRVTGNLTVKDITAPATFDVTVNAIGDHPLADFFDVYQGDFLGLTATATVSRSEFGLGALAMTASDEIEIVINTEMKAGGFPG
ncbi:MAG: YceI family protein [Paracoccaceae bacterium]|jgi:polyisoprenoid-binding protein YceI|nr:YceI family protein [Paracoccaceae bacterium]